MLSLRYMKQKSYKLKGKLWIYPGDAAWHFLTVGKKETSDIKESYTGLTRGFGSLPVEVTLGKSKWRTSIFPDSRSGTFVLPVKKSVRQAEGIYDGDDVSFSITIKPK